MLTVSVWHRRSVPNRDAEHRSGRLLAERLFVQPRLSFAGSRFGSIMLAHRAPFTRTAEPLRRGLLNALSDPRSAEDGRWRLIHDDAAVSEREIARTEFSPDMTPFTAGRAKVMLP